LHRRIRLRSVLGFAAVLAMPLTAAHADQIKLKNGDLLTGSIVKKEATTVVFKTSYAGTLNVQWSEIENITSDDPVHLVLSDGSSLHGELVPTDPGEIGLEQEDGGEEKNFSLMKTRYINPSPDLTGEGYKWTGNINAGGTLTQGNSETKGINIDGETIFRALKNRFTFSGYFHRLQDRGHNTQFNSRANGKYDRFLEPQWYVYANTSFENDRFRDLKLRSTAGVGTGYQIFETPNLNLSIEGGVNYIKEDFYNARDDSYPGLRWALRYDQMLFHSSTKFFHEHEVLMDIQQTSHYLLTSKTGIRFPPIYNFNASTQFQYNWDSQPAVGRKRSDSILMFTLGYGW
jgi:putative salt-induced outer membrane protein YdiY